MLSRDTLPLGDSSRAQTTCARDPGVHAAVSHHLDKDLVFHIVMLALLMNHHNKIKSAPLRKLVDDQV